MSEIALTRPGGQSGSSRLRRRPSAMTVVVWLLIGLIAALILYPLVTAFVRVGVDLATGADSVRLSDLVAQPNLYLNTSILVISAGALALVVGSLLACINERTDATFHTLGRILPLAPLLVHPLASATGWVVLLDPRVGLVNGWLRGGLTPFGVHLSTVRSTCIRFRRWSASACCSWRRLRS